MNPNENINEHMNVVQDINNREPGATPSSNVAGEKYETLFSNHVIAALLDKKPANQAAMPLYEINRSMIAEGIMKKYDTITEATAMAKVIEEIGAKSFEELYEEYGQSHENETIPEMSKGDDMESDGAIAA